MMELQIKLRKSRVVPFGWKLSSIDHKYLVEVPDEQEALRRAKKYIEVDHLPWRSVREWLVRATGRKISVTGLRKILGCEKWR